jgi:hypothetical protein
MTSRCGPCGLWQALGLSEPKARLTASDDGLRTVWHAQLAEDVIDVIPNRLRAQAQPVRNLHVVKSRCDEVEDLALTFGELVKARLLLSRSFRMAPQEFSDLVEVLAPRWLMLEENVVSAFERDELRSRDCARAFAYAAPAFACTDFE